MQYLFLGCPVWAEVMVHGAWVKLRKARDILSTWPRACLLRRLQTKRSRRSFQNLRVSSSLDICTYKTDPIQWAYDQRLCTKEPTNSASPDSHDDVDSE